MHRFLLHFVLLSLLFCTLAAAQTGQTGYFLTRLGKDTIAVEQYSFDSRGLQGTVVARSPRTTIRDYSAALNANGDLESFHITSHRPDGTLVFERDFMYTNDSVRVTVKQDTSTTRYAVSAPGQPFPLFIDLFGGWQVALKRALAAGKHFGLLSGKQVFSYSIEGNPPGEIKLVNLTGYLGPLHLEVSKDGQIDKFDMTETTDKFVAERIPSADVKMLAKEFAEREQSGHALGVLSPRDTVRAEIDGAHLMIDYGRPAARGRVIIGGVVPWDSVWRTGANAATQLITDRDLQFGSTSLPAGTYSLFTIPAKSGWTLIINSDHGQWGTDYDKAKDFARLPLTTKQMDNLVERFTFGIDQESNGGVVHLQWEHTDASIPFTVK